MYLSCNVRSNSREEHTTSDVSDSDGWWIEAPLHQRDGDSDRTKTAQTRLPIPNPIADRKLGNVRYDS